MYFELSSAALFSSRRPRQSWRFVADFCKIAALILNTRQALSRVSVRSCLVNVAITRTAEGGR